ncbi:MAG: site-2 protease family protein [Pseudomonadota bacterium]|nr:site-2 protease family protein [Pseudomonadota bacterium]
MIQSLIDILLKLVIAAIPVILALTLPVAATGRVANRLGDTTARAHRRLTFNPLPHIDPVGTLAVPFICFVFSFISHSPLLLMGWAKPLPLNDYRLRRPHTDPRWVAGAGIGANLAMAVLWAVLFHIVLRVAAPDDGYSLAGVLAQMGQYGLQVNAVFAAISLIPVPPMPGGRILLTLLDRRKAQQLEQLQPHATWIVLILLLSGVLRVVIVPIIWLADALATLLTGF